VTVDNAVNIYTIGNSIDFKILNTWSDTMRLIEKWEVQLEWQTGEVETIPVETEAQALKVSDYYETSADGVYLDSTIIRRIRHYRFVEPSKVLASSRLIGEEDI
jgi:hypothetical protein